MPGQARIPLRSFDLRQQRSEKRYSIHAHRFRIPPPRRLQCSFPFVLETWMAKLRDAFAIGPAFLAMQQLLHSRFVPVLVSPPDLGMQIREN